LADGEAVGNASEFVRSRPTVPVNLLRLKELESRHVRIRLAQSSF